MAIAAPTHICSTSSAKHSFAYLTMPFIFQGRFTSDFPFGDFGTTSCPRGVLYCDVPLEPTITNIHYRVTDWSCLPNAVRILSPTGFNDALFAVTPAGTYPAAPVRLFGAAALRRCTRWHPRLRRRARSLRP